MLAEKEYYTWVDEFGRVHNTLINPSSKNKSKDESKIESSKSSPINTEEFLTEEEFERQSKKDRSDSPEFYTWVDEHGRVRNQAVPQVEVTVEKDDEYQPQVTDHTLVLPLRLRSDIQQAGCCQSYSMFFKEPLAAFKSRVFSKPQFSHNFYTQSGNKPAWFFKLSDFKLDNESLEPVLKLRLRDTDKPMAFIALNKDWQPLYAIPELKPQYYSATWRTVAMHETLISVADEEVSAVIVYFPQGVENTANLEVLWLP